MDFLTRLCNTVASSLHTPTQTHDDALSPVQMDVTFNKGTDHPVTLSGSPQAMGTIAKIAPSDSKVDATIIFDCGDTRKFFEAAGISTQLTERIATCAEKHSGCTKAFEQCVKENSKK